MKFQIGDKVKFMDQMGEGVITKILGPSTLGVTVDGFELPYAAGDLIKIEAPASAAERLFYEGKATYGNPEPKEEDPKKAPAPKTWADYGLEEDDTPAASPTPAPAAEEDPADLRIQPLQRGFVSKKPQPEGILQGLFCMEKSQTWLKPFSQTFKIKAAQLSQTENYVLPVFMREKVLLIPMLDAAAHEAENGIAFQERNGKPVRDEGEGSVAGKVQTPNKTNPLSRYMIAKDTAEVDLHIEKLLETRLECRNIEEREYLSKQIAVFETCLNQAMEQKLSKIIFIHGVGEGTLKHEIEKRLKQYPDVHFMDASITRYGRGAIEVYLKA